MNWKKVKLEEICQMNSGGTPSRSKQEYYGGNILWAKISDIENAKTGIITETEERITEQGLKAINNRIFEANTLLLAMYGSVGKTAITGCKLSTNQAILGIRPLKDDIISLQFLKYWLLYKKEELLNRAVGGTLQNISLGIVKNLEIPLPDLHTQQHIAKVLDQADALRQQNRQLLAHYDELLQSTFIDLFGDPVKNEKGWEVKKLGEVSEVISGVAKNGNLNGDLIETPYMRVANVQDGQLNLSEIKTIHVFKKDFEKYQLKYNDILMTEGGDPDKLGRAAIWKEQIKYCIHQNHIFRVRPDFSIIDSGYLCLLVGSSYGKRYFLKAAKQTTGIASINITQLKNFPIPIPPLSLQQKFAQLVEQIEEQKAVVKQSLAESEVLFEGLLAEYFG